MVFLKRPLNFLLFCLLTLPLFGQAQSTPKPKPHVVVVGVNGMELDVIRPLLLKGKMPNLSRVIKNGAYGKLRTVSAPNCPRVYSTIFTSTKPEEHGVTGFIVGGITANTNMLKEEPIWSMLSKNGVTVGMANVPATFPVMPVNGYMISGMLTRGQELRRRRALRSQALGSAGRRRGLSSGHEGGVAEERGRFLHRLRAHAFG